jgi:hypothetical protein
MSLSLFVDVHTTLDRLPFAVAVDRAARIDASKAAAVALILEDSGDSIPVHRIGVHRRLIGPQTLPIRILSADPALGEVGTVGIRHCVLVEPSIYHF